ncbi:hypothetical protein N4R57_15065 [Rhodobacteraceae bacterium D3-12]|nr:hypothetical protein N4R57_15065 [Rhodobacteraceae bacterium D3-12]
MKFSRSLALVSVFALLAACKNPEDAAKELSRAGLEAQTAIGEALQTRDLDSANKLADGFATTLRSTINDNFDGDFCTVPFAGIDCDSTKTAADMSEKSRNLLGRTAQRYDLMRRLIAESTPVTDPLLADFRVPSAKTAKTDLIAVLAGQDSVQSRILFNSLTRQAFETCKDMRALANEFERDDAYKRLTQPGEMTAPKADKPLKGMVAIEGGKYDLNAEAFRPTGKLAKAGRKSQAYKVSGRFRITRKLSDITVKIPVHTCKGDELRSFSEELRKRGDLQNPFLVLKREIKVSYRAPALQNLLTGEIPVPKDKAESLVKDFSKSPLQMIREERPMLVTINFEPRSIKDLTIERDFVVLPVDVTHLAYYPLTRPVVTDSLLRKDFYIGMMPRHVFGRTSYPSVAPLFQKSLGAN